MVQRRVFYRLQGEEFVGYSPNEPLETYFKVLEQIEGPERFRDVETNGMDVAFEDEATARRWAERHAAETGRRTQVQQASGDD